MNTTRNYIPTIAIIIVGASIAWWSSHTASSMSKHIQDEVTKLVPQFHMNPSVIQSLLVDPILEPMLASSLSYIYEETKDNHEYRVVVTRGDNKKFGDGTATHVAMFQVDHTPVTGLRIICEHDGDPLRIAGIFMESPKVSGAAAP
jgi:hypothetical protein